MNDVLMEDDPLVSSSRNSNKFGKLVWVCVSGRNRLLSFHSENIFDNHAIIYFESDICSPSVEHVR